MVADVSPPAPRIRLRVGISGHRAPPKLPAQSEAPLRAMLDSILASIADTARSPDNDFARIRPVTSECEFVVISSLAEGSDRLAAEAGLTAGYSLEAVLPFARAEYTRDFATPESRAAFERLLKTASAVFELDGAAGERNRAYEAAGFVMLANIDLLIAIWDGEGVAGVGGTAQIVNRAIADGIPVVRLDPLNPSAMQLSWPQPGDLPPAHAYSHHRHTFRATHVATLKLVVQHILALPDDAAVLLPQYLAERERRWNFLLFYPLLLGLFGVRAPRRADFHLPPALAETQKQWEGFFTSLPRDRSQYPALEKILLPAFSAADHLSVFYSLAYRGNYVYGYFLAAITVALALSGIFIQNILMQIYEVAFIFGILSLWMAGRRQQSHRRWLQYRRLAECLRHMRILAPLGAEGPISRPGVDVDGEDWVDWYAWSLRRLIPLPDRAVDQAYIATMRDIVHSCEIADQTDYHTTNARRLATLEKRMHGAGFLLFATTFALAALFVVLYFIDFPRAEGWHNVFTFLTALLPTLGAALGAIAAQGDFRTRAEQSERTAARLAAIDELLASEPLDFARLSDRVQKTSDVMMADLEEWQTVFRTRPLSLPA
jgi:hypothetical protein